MDEELAKQLENHEKRIRELEQLLSSAPVEGGARTKQISLREFLLTKNPTNDVQRALVISYYLERQRGLAMVKVRELNDGFREAKENVPTNLNDTLNQNVHKGHMMECKEKKDKRKAWTLTNSGMAFVDHGLNS